ncbi:hypothetical protein F5B20DRAFT_41713 [Whalleya microplaca]|nr:hypothetical protein F5B20DRAFT_41713 [Whalleya microplaca]
MLPAHSPLISLLLATLALAPTHTTASGSQSANITNAPPDTPPAAVPVLRLVDLNQCPTTPKPTCSDAQCQGPVHICATQYRCTSETPFPFPVSDRGSTRSAVLAGCRCCPLPIHVACDNYDCGAPEGARVCDAEELRGCACLTWADRREAVEADAELVLGTGEGEDLVEVYPDYPSEEEAEGEGGTTVMVRTTASRYPAMATLQPFWLVSL